MAGQKSLNIINKKTVWEGNFIRVVLLEYCDESGNVRRWEAVERVNCDGIVAVIPVTEEGELLMIRQFRPALNNYVIEFPAGLNDKGESLADAARRELIEETGYVSDELELMAEGPVSSGLSTEVLTVFLAKKAVPASAALRERYPIEETEDIEVIKCPLMSAYETINEYLKKGDAADLKIYGFIELAQKRMDSW
ncbi:MAG TPA: NUDIX hydrolase [Dissulfurispiraceae bacterium]|nr:NUDIX hydrolase [Dissulfurispiraceae bacterium]